jgi:hypothetical protein
MKKFSPYELNGINSDMAKLIAIRNETHSSRYIEDAKPRALPFETGAAS